MSSATLWNPAPAPFFQSDGQFASGAKASFFSAGTTTPLTVYQTAALTTAHQVPVVASNIGVFPAIFLPFNDYRVRIVDQNAALIFDADNISNPAPPEAGGGIVVTQDMVFQVGDQVWRLRTGIMAGFVRMNGNTLGSATSGATEYANADALNLFLHIWTTFTNADAPVSGGRGASASDDFIANKTIEIPTMRGLCAAGLDDMGGTSSGQLQSITTCTTNNTSSVTVVSATGLTVGMHAIVAGVGGRTITAIGGTFITLSSIVSGVASGVTFRASFFTDATILASGAGGTSSSITADQMPAHTHAAVASGGAHTHSINIATGTNSYAAGGNFAHNANVGDVSSSTTPSIAVNLGNTGGGNPFRTLTPTRLGTWYMKR